MSKLTLEKFLEHAAKRQPEARWEAVKETVYNGTRKPITLKCLLCGKIQTKKRAEQFYDRGCSCQTREKIRKTSLAKYGVEHFTQAESVQQKVRQTVLERYGVEHISQSDLVKEKRRQTNLERYGVENPFQRKEVQEKAKETMMNKYGVEHASKSQEVKDKVKQTVLERYGVKHISQAPSIKEKVKQTNLEKLGVEYPMQSPLVRAKSRAAVLERYGVEYISQAPEIQEKIKITNLDKYGYENASKSEEVKQKTRSTNLLRYGVEATSQTEEVKAKARATCLERYGYEYSMQSPQVRVKSTSTIREKYGVEHILQSPEIQEKIRQTNFERYGMSNWTQRGLSEEELLFHKSETLEQALINLNERLARKPTLKEIMAASGYRSFSHLYNLGLSNYSSLYQKVVSHGEELIKSFLNTAGASYCAQYSYVDLLSPKSVPLRFDFAILGEDQKALALIEYDGQQHFEFNSRFHADEEEFAYRQSLDTLKDEYCTTHNIPFLRLPYYLTKAELEEELRNFLSTLALVLVTPNK